MKPLHVMYLIDGLQVGGAEVLLCNFARGLLHEGVRVTVGYSTPGPLVEDLQIVGVPLIQFPRLATLDPVLVWRMFKAIKHIQPDIVHTHLFKSDMHGRPAARLAEVPVVVSTLHNCNDWARNPIMGHAYGIAARLADRLIAVSDEVRRFTIDKMHVPHQQVCTIPNAVPIEQFQNQAVAGDRLRAEFGLAVNTPLVGIVARLIPQKDHAVFLQAAAQVLHELPQARFLIAGEGPLRKALETHAEALGITHAVLFAGLRKDIPAVMAAIDILAFSSRWEGLPVAMLEGMAASTPIVATAVDGIPGVIADGTNGLLVPSQDATALAAALLRVLRDPELAQRLGTAGAAHVEAHYSFRANIRSTLQLYHTLLEQASKNQFHYQSNQ